jgi:hypothetical protein
VPPSSLADIFEGEVEMRSTWWVLLAAGCALEEGEESAPERWLVRMAERTEGCAPVAGDGWSWMGEPLRSPAGPSPDFCVYEWVSEGGLPAEPEQLSSRYALLDERAHEEPREVRWTPVEAVAGRRGGIGNCEVCVSWQDDWLWIVLPPDLGGWTLNGRYGPEQFESSEEQVFWGSVPEDLLGEALYVTL